MGSRSDLRIFITGAFWITGFFYKRTRINTNPVRAHRRDAENAKKKNLMPSGKSNDRIVMDINKLSSEIMREGIVRIVNNLDE